MPQMWDEYACDACGPLRLARSSSEAPLTVCPFCTGRGAEPLRPLGHKRAIAPAQRVLQRHAASLSAHLDELAVMGPTERQALRQDVGAVLERLDLLDGLLLVTKH